MRCFFQTAPLIYASVVRLAAEHRTAEQLTGLKAIQNGFDLAVKACDAAQATLANHRFHALTGDMAANPYLVPSLARMLIYHTRLSQTFYTPASPRDAALVQEAYRQHDEMIVAFEARDAEGAVALTLKHWDLSRDRMEEFVRPDPLPLIPTEPEHTHAV